jgi:DNA-directed RNA polymerase II subunit RPB2
MSIDNIQSKMKTSPSENNLSTDDLFRLADLYFYKRNYIFRHLYDSYNKFLEEDVKNYLERADHIFNEKITIEGTVYRRKFRFRNTRIIGPKLENGIEPMFPSDAIHKSMTYGVKIICDVTQIQDKIDMVTNKKSEIVCGTEEIDVPIAYIPLMVRSKYCSLNQYKGMDSSECDFNPGGYFIVNGSEKVVICQDRMVENKPLVFLKKDSGILSYIVQVNSRSYRPNGSSQVLNVKIRKDGLMTIRVPILNEVNVFALFRALGVQSDKDIIKMIVTDDSDSDMIDLIRITLDACKNENHIKIQTEEEAFDFLINKLKVIRRYTETDKDTKLQQKKMHLKSLLHTSFIPHIEGSLMEKAFYLGYMINKLLKVYLGRATVDDRDSYINKRVDLPGDLLFELFRQRFKIMLSDCNKFFSRNDNDEKPLIIINQIKPNTIEQGMKASLSTGAWIRKKGVAQMLQVYTYLQKLVFLRRVDTPSGDASSSKLTSPRQLHPSSVGFLCVVETPEHAKVGVTKHLSLIGSITIMSEDIYNVLRQYIKSNVINILDIPIDLMREKTKIFLNGEWLGVTDNPIDFSKKINQMKMKGEIDRENVSIVSLFSDNEIRIYCDSGRFYRPVIKVDNNIIKLTKQQLNEISLNKLQKSSKITDWEEFITKFPDVIEYIDTELQPYLLIATKVDDVIEMRQKMLDSIKEVKNVTETTTHNRYNNLYFEEKTHLEIHPSLLLGVLSTNVPFANRNPGPRNIFQYSQGRQAMGIYATNYRDRTDISYILYHPQKPLLTTRTSKYIGSEILPSGENVMVAIACYSGYNQEDSLVINRDSVHRGMLRSKSIKKYVSIAQKNQSTAQDDIFMKPDSTKVIGMRHGSYDKLNDKGYVPEETMIFNGDIILGKVTPIDETGDSNKQFKDSSEVYKSHAPAVIDRVYTGIQNLDGYEIRKVVTRSERIPMIGDKFCSRYGQKGTCGILMPAIDMPFNKYGIRPDIILNPNAIPSRQTIGQLLESLVGKVAGLDVVEGDGTPFEEFDLTKVEKRLEQLGYDPKGYEELYNGMTGEKLKMKIYFGPTYYQRLKHMVQDKLHGRARGPRTLLTRQPPEGRSRDGGLRLGEMERDALIAHGVSKFLHEKMMYNSDAYVTYICDHCGLFAQRAPRKENKKEPTSTDVFQCVYCNNSNHISKVMIPYAFKLLMQELMAMNIAPRIRTKKQEF